MSEVLDAPKAKRGRPPLNRDANATASVAKSSAAVAKAAAKVASGSTEGSAPKRRKPALKKERVEFSYKPSKQRASSMPDLSEEEKDWLFQMGAALCTQRMALNMTLHELSGILGIGFQTLYRMEKGFYGTQILTWKRAFKAVGLEFKLHVIKPSADA